MIYLKENKINKFGNNKIYLKDKVIYQAVKENKPIEPKILIYGTLSDNSEVTLTYHSNYFEYIKIIEDDVTLDLSSFENNEAKYTFKNKGDHQVEVEFKKDITSVNGLFQYNERLKEIPSNLFEGCESITNVSFMFGLSSRLPIIPEDIFKPLVNLENVSTLFSTCSTMTELNVNLFQYNKNITNAWGIFENNQNLVSIPTYLFKNNKKITEMQRCFYNCTSLTVIPLDENDKPLYNRSNGEDGYTVPTNTTDCFTNCKKVPEYSSIPNDWK